MNLALSGDLFSGFTRAVTVARIHPIQNGNRAKALGFSGLLIFYHILFPPKSAIGAREGPTEGHLLEC